MLFFTSSEFLRECAIKREMGVIRRNPAEVIDGVVREIEIMNTETRNREGGIGGDGTGYVMLRRVFDEETAENDIVLDDGTPWASPRCRQSSTGSARFPIFFCRILIRRSIFRVNTIVQQFPQFYETYGITEDDGMRLNRKSVSRSGDEKTTYRSVGIRFPSTSNL